MSSDKKRILFVDDDPSVLAGLRNIFHRDRKRWDMVFANGGEEALTELEASSFDVVVSDMRMPGVDGVMLLEKVRELSPRTARVMLSGSADKEEVDRATRAVDELLGKPCDSKTLRATLERLIAKQ
jgi:YesN/AraC family two-component response regulator